MGLELLLQAEAAAGRAGFRDVVCSVDADNVNAMKMYDRQAYTMTKCAKPLRHSAATSGTRSFRSTNQNAPFGRLSTTCR